MWQICCVPTHLHSDKHKRVAHSQKHTLKHILCRSAARSTRTCSPEQHPAHAYAVLNREQHTHSHTNVHLHTCSAGLQPAQHARALLNNIQLMPPPLNPNAHIPEQEDVQGRGRSFATPSPHHGRSQTEGNGIAVRVVCCLCVFECVCL